MLKNCTECGKVYQGPNPEYCQECLDKAEKEFRLVRNFIKDNPKVAISVVEEATGIPEERIRDFLRMGRLDIADLSGPVLECVKCGKPIHCGQYCVLCQGEIADSFRTSNPKPEVKKETKTKSFTERYQDRD